MTYIDDLDVGDFVAITTGDVVQQQNPFVGFSFWSDCEPKAKPRSGIPLEIVAISLPFICVHDGRRTFAIDIHATSLQRLSKEYVKAMREHEGEGPSPRRRRKKEKRDPLSCPRCGDKRIQQRSAKTDWKWICKRCGYDGEQPIIA